MYDWDEDDKEYEEFIAKRYEEYILKQKEKDGWYLLGELFELVKNDNRKDIGVGK